MQRWLSILCAVVVLVVGSPLNARTHALAKELESKETPQAVIKIDIPEILLRIGGCESNGDPHSKPRQFDKNGSVLAGVVNPRDRGAWQINSSVWGKIAQEKGYDLETYEGNLKMALWIYENYGTEPWKYSKSCWK